MNERTVLLVIAFLLCIGIAIWPLDLQEPIAYAEETSGMGLRNNPMGGSLDLFHNGVDLRGPKGSLVSASASGFVIEVYAPSPGHPVYGGMVRLLHEDGSTTLYGHLSVVHVWLDWYVEQGAVVGVQGSTGYSTGDHLHFEHNTPPVFTAVDPRAKQDKMIRRVLNLLMADQLQQFYTY